MVHLIDSQIHAVAEHKTLLDSILELGQELVIDALLDQDPV